MTCVIGHAQPGFADLLLCLADFALLPQPRAAAQELLDMLPTDLAVLSNIRAACMSDAPAARFAELLGCAGPGRASAPRPARLMYTLQVHSQMILLLDYACFDIRWFMRLFVTFMFRT